MTRRGTPFIRNDNSVYIEGFVDLNDPTEDDGNPKWINGATGYWEVRDAPVPEGYQATPASDGHLIATGTPIDLGGGQGYRCDLSHGIALELGTTYYFHVVLISPAGYVVDCEDSWEPTVRTGRTPTG